MDADHSTAATFTQSWLLWGIRSSPKTSFSEDPPFLQHADSDLGNSSQFLTRLHVGLLSKTRATAADHANLERRMCTKPTESAAHGLWPQLSGSSTQANQGRSLPWQHKAIRGLSQSDQLNNHSNPYNATHPRRLFLHEEDHRSSASGSLHRNFPAAIRSR